MDEEAIVGQFKSCLTSEALREGGFNLRSFPDLHIFNVVDSEGDPGPLLRLGFVVRAL